MSTQSSFVVYDDRGRILRWGDCPSGDATQQGSVAEGTHVLIVRSLAGVSDETHFVKGFQLHQREALPLSWQGGTPAVGKEVVLPGLPVPCTVSRDGVYVKVDDGSYEFTPLTAGRYTIVFDEPAYLRQEWVISVY